MDVDLDSVPGICSLSRLGTTNRQVFGSDGENYSVDRLRLVRLAVRDRYEAVTSGLYEADPLKVFIKQEPHKASKIAEGRYRLIMSVSLVDALVDRILFMKLMWQVVSKFTETKIMIGWNPGSGGYRLMESLFGKQLTMSIDRKAWDWTVKPWLLDAVCDVICQLAVNAPSWWKTAVRVRFSMLFEKPVFVFPDGSYGYQPMAGVMKSGCYLTIFINSVCQLILHRMSLIKLSLDPMTFVCLGDDTLQAYFDRWEEYVAYQESLGFRVEVEMGRPGEMEFAGFVFGKGYVPAYRQKHLFMLEHLTTDPDVASMTLFNYQVLYYFVPEMKEYIRDLIDTLELPAAFASDERLVVIASG